MRSGNCIMFHKRLIVSEHDQISPDQGFFLITYLVNRPSRYVHKPCHFLMQIYSMILICTFILCMRS
uniref:Uncharacterized protein n=1 Tax=Arundo donax TaxID=35708 RepID=A0A0A9EVF1_ARUDO